MEWLRKTLATGQRAPFPEWRGLSEEEGAEATFTTLLAHYDLHQSQGHRSCAREVLEVAQGFVDDGPEYEYRWLRKWARWLESVGRRDEALDRLKAHLRRLRGKLANPTRNADLRMELGIMTDRAGHKEESLRYFRDAAQRYRKLNHTYNFVAALFNSASVLHDLGHHNEALKVCKRALQEGASGYRDLAGHISLQMANSLESQQSTEQSANFYRQAEESYGQLGNRRQQGDILYRLGWLAVRAKRMSEGASFLRQSLELKREHDYASGLAWYHWSRAEAYRAAGVTKKAIGYYRSALNLALCSNQDVVAAHCRILLFQLCAKPDQQLSAFVRYGNPSAVDSIVKQGRAGLYLDHASDGYSLGIFREPGDTQRGKPDRKVLGRLVHDLEKVTKAGGVTPSPTLERQRLALARWIGRQQKD